MRRKGLPGLSEKYLKYTRMTENDCIWLVNVQNVFWIAPICLPLKMQMTLMLNLNVLFLSFPQISLSHIIDTMWIARTLIILSLLSMRQKNLSSSQKYLCTCETFFELFLEYHIHQDNVNVERVIIFDHCHLSILHYVNTNA